MKRLVATRPDGAQRGRAQGPQAPEPRPSRSEAGRREQAKRDSRQGKTTSTVALRQLPREGKP